VLDFSPASGVIKMKSSSSPSDRSQELELEMEIDRDKDWPNARGSLEWAPECTEAAI